MLNIELGVYFIRLHSIAATSVNHHVASAVRTFAVLANTCFRINTSLRLDSIQEVIHYLVHHWEEHKLYVIVPFVMHYNVCQ